MAVKSLGPLLHSLLTLSLESVTKPGILVLVAHEFVSCATIDLLELCHLFAKLILVLSHLEQGLLLPEVLPASEGSIFVMLVDAINQSLYEASLDTEPPPKELQSIIYSLLLLEVQSKLHFAEPFLVSVFLIYPSGGPSVFVPGHAKEPPAHLR